VNNTNTLRPQFDTATRYVDTTTEKFAPIRTADAVDALLDNGWQIQTASVAKTRTLARQPFARHAATLSFPDDQSSAEFRPQILIVNSNDGGSAFKLFAGIYRFICANGIVVGSTFEGISIRHIGDVDTIKGRIVEGAARIRRGAPVLGAWAEQFRNTELNPSQILQFNSVAAGLRFPRLGDREKLANLALQFDLVRRREDQNNDLWSTFNRVQETAIRGGIHSGNRRVRGLSSIGRNVSLNRSLWDLAVDTREGRLAERYDAFQSSIQDAVLI
jgi:hypothetical protein